MQNYNFTPENIDDINGQKSEFFSLVLEQTEDLVNLGLLSNNDFETAEKLFWTKFIQNHEEIRSDIKLTRHFIIKKKDKLMKELKTPLFMSNIYDKLMDETKNLYWKFVHTVFLVLESCHKEKNDAIINTLTGELAKLIKLEEEKVSELSELSKKSIKNKASTSGQSRLKNKKLGNNQELDISTMNDLLQKMGGQDSNNNIFDGLDMSKMAEMMKDMDMSKMGGVLGMDMSKMGDMMKGMDMSKMGDMMKGIDMSKIGEMLGGLDTSNMGGVLGGLDMSKVGEMLGGIDMSKVGEMMKDTENMENMDMSKMLNAIMPGMETKKNDALMNNLINDITSNMGNLESSEQVFEITKQLGEKYQKMIVSGEIDSSEIIGSLMGLMTDKKFTEELSKIDMSKIKPDEMVAKMMEKMSPEMLGGMTGMADGKMDLTNIGSLLSGITGMGAKSSDIKPSDIKQLELSEEQLKEMEEYYSKLSLEDPKLD